MASELDQKAIELALAVQKLQQLTRELEDYSRDIKKLSEQISGVSSDDDR